MAKGFQTQIKSEQKKKQSLIVESCEDIQEKLLRYVEEVEDPRVKRTQKHLLKDILTIAILAAIAGAEGWEDMENYGISKYSWLKEFLELPNGIPSDDTFRRVFERIKPEELEKVFQKWIQHSLNLKPPDTSEFLSFFSQKVLLFTAREALFSLDFYYNLC